ncbi:MAG: type II secretion system F family protein [Phycisphaerales bacterium JB063]
MPQFTYKARDNQGEITTGTLEAPTAEEAGNRLRSQGRFIVTLDEAGASDDDWQPKTGRQRIRKQDVITFSHQLSVMVDTGVPISEALQCCADQSDCAGFKVVLQDVAERVQSGSDLSSSMQQHPKVFPTVMCSLIKASELSGTMGKMLDRISKYMSKEAGTLRKIKGALTYPAVMIAFVTLVTVLLLMFVLPRFATIYAGRGAALPGPTRLLLGISGSFHQYWWAYAAGACALAALVACGFVTQTGRGVVDYLKLNTPVVGPMFRKLYVTRATRTMGTMIDAGVPILDMIPIAKSVTANRYYDVFWELVDHKLRTGSQLSEPFFKGGELMPQSVAQMISAGEKSGRLGEVLHKVAEFTEEEFDEQVKNATKFIEPAMVVVMGAIIGFVAIALLLPIFQVSTVVSG